VFVIAHMCMCTCVWCVCAWKCGRGGRGKAARTLTALCQESCCEPSDSKCFGTKAQGNMSRHYVFSVITNPRSIIGPNTLGKISLWHEGL
jgi:hypothetical protein